MADLDDVVAELTRVWRVICDMQEAQEKFFTQMLAVLKEMSAAATEISWDIKLVLNSLDDVTKSLKSLEDHFMPPPDMDDFP